MGTNRTLLGLCPRPVGGGAGALSGDRRPSSVCLSDVAYIGSNSKTNMGELHQPYFILSRDYFLFLTPEFIST